MFAEKKIESRRYAVRAASLYKDTPLFQGIKSSCTCRTAAISMSPLATPIT